MATLILNPTHTGGLTISHPDGFLDITIPINNGEFPIMWQTTMVVPNNEVIAFIPESNAITIQGSTVLTPNQIGLVQNQNGENIWKVTAFNQEPKTRIIQEVLTEDKTLSSGDPTWQVLPAIADNISVILSDTEHDEFVIINAGSSKPLTIKKADGTIFLTMNAETRLVYLKRADTDWVVLPFTGFITS